MNNELELNIQKLKEIIEKLNKLAENKAESELLASIFAQLLAKIAVMFESVEQRLQALEKHHG